MFAALTRIITITTVASLLYAIPANARLKYYRYNNNIPMAEMTLRMMIAAGVLDEVPATIVQDGNPYNRLYARRTGYGFQDASVNPYSTLLDEPYYGSSPYYDNSLFDGTRYGGYYNHDPYSTLYGGLFNRHPHSALDTYRLYSNPLGVAPYGGGYYGRGYGGYGYRGHGYGGRYPYSYAQPRGAYGARPWGGLWNRYGSGPYSHYPGSVYNSWTSPWTSPWSVPWSGGWPGVTYAPSSLQAPANGYLPSQSTDLMPMTGVPHLSSTGRNPWSGQVPVYGSVPVQSGPLLQWRQSLVRPYVTTGRIPLGYGNSEPAVRARHIPPAGASNPPLFDWDATASDLPAPGDAPNIFNAQLEGLWVTEDGEYLGLRDNEFLWTDGQELYEKGTISATADTLVARSEGSSSTVSYRYRLGEDELLTVGQDGKMREYTRVPIEEGVALLPEENEQPSLNPPQIQPLPREEKKLRQ